eukprot:scaffold27966_cov64-Phaeocystis_antarctica.AAC.5
MHAHARTRVHACMSAIKAQSLRSKARPGIDWPSTKWCWLLALAKPPKDLKVSTLSFSGSGTPFFMMKAPSRSVPPP